MRLAAGTALALLLTALACGCGPAALGPEARQRPVGPAGTTCTLPVPPHLQAVPPRSFLGRACDVPPAEALGRAKADALREAAEYFGVRVLSRVVIEDHVGSKGASSTYDARLDVHSVPVELASVRVLGTDVPEEAGGRAAFVLIGLDEAQVAHLQRLAAGLVLVLAECRGAAAHTGACPADVVNEVAEIPAALELRPYAGSPASAADFDELQRLGVAFRLRADLRAGEIAANHGAVFAIGTGRLELVDTTTRGGGRTVTTARLDWEPAGYHDERLRGRSRVSPQTGGSAAALRRAEADAMLQAVRLLRERLRGGSARAAAP